MNINDLKNYKVVSSANAKPVSGQSGNDSQMPILTNPNGGFGTAIKDIAVGAGKDLVGTAVGTAGLLQSGGKAVMGAFGADTSKLGFNSLDSSTPEGQVVANSLESKSRGEQVGKVLSTVGQLGTGFVKSGIQPALKARQAANLGKSTESHALDLVSPKITPEISEQAIKQGRVTEPKFLSTSKIIPDKQQTAMADAVKPFISPKKTILQNTDAIDKGIRQINNGVKEYVAQNKVPFNTNQLKTQLNAGKDELKLIFASDKTAERTYNAVVDEFLKHVNTKDTAGLFEARQSVDKIPAIKKLLDSQGLGENVKKEVVLTVREMANRYISNLLPKGNQFRESLLKESKMIRAIENIAEKNQGMIGKNNLQILAQRYPILKFIVGGAAAGAVGTAGIGLGGAIIGSTN